MISEALCDAENKCMSYYAENSALHHRKKLHFKIHGKNLMIWMTDQKELQILLLEPNVTETKSIHHSVILAWS